VTETETIAKPAKAKTPESPEAQRASLEVRHAELQEMNGLPVDLVRQAQEAVEARRREMAEIESQLAELDAATGARAKAQREEAHRTKLDREEALRKELVELEEKRLKQVAEAEAGARQFASSLKAAAETTVAQRKIAVALGARGAGYWLDETGLISRCASRLGGVVCAHGGHQNNWSRGTLGTVKWTGTSLYPADQNWAEAEEKLTAPAIISIVEKKDMI
jgi:hypothetical protein